MLSTTLPALGVALDEIFEDQLEGKRVVAAPPAEGDAVGGFADVAPDVLQVPVARRRDFRDREVNRIERWRFVLGERRRPPEKALS